MKNNLVPFEKKQAGGIEFHIKRWLHNNFVFKQIDFIDDDQRFSFVEKVKALRLEDFQEYFRMAGMGMTHVFGDYDLNEFEEEASPRIILIFH